MKAIMEKALRYLLPGLGDILWIGVFLSVVGMGPRMMNIDGDLGRHLTIGAYILDHRQVPTTDLFSHTMYGLPLTPHEWLSQVVFAIANRLLGLDGVILVCGLVIAASFWLVYRRARSTSREVLAAVLVTLLAMAAASLHWLSRPHVFTFLMLALWMQVLDSMRCGRANRWWLLPALMLPWANLHGAFIAGFATWALYGAGMAWDTFWKRLPEEAGLPDHFWRSYLLGGSSALLVTLLNPSGFGLWGTSVGYVGNAYLVGHTAEYLPPDFHSPSTWPFLMMIGMLVVVFGLQSRKPLAAHVIPAAAWMVLGLYSVRNVPLFAIVAAPVLAGALADWIAAGNERVKGLAGFAALDQRLLITDLSLRGILWPVLAVLLVIAGYRAGMTPDVQQRGNAFDPEQFPVQAVDWLAEHPQQGNMFNYFPWGGYLLYRDWPEQRVFIDGQTDFYGEALTRQYEQVITLSPGWEAVLDSHAVRWVIIPSDEALAGALQTQKGWQRVYEDQTTVIFRRLE